MTILFRVLTLLALWLVMETASAYIYHDLEKRFGAGQNVTFEEALGIWVGRCYEEKDPGRPIAAVVEFFYSERAQHGPAFDEEFAHKVISHVDSEIEPDFMTRVRPV